MFSLMILWLFLKTKETSAIPTSSAEPSKIALMGTGSFLKTLCVAASRADCEKLRIPAKQMMRP